MARRLPRGRTSPVPRDIDRAASEDGHTRRTMTRARTRLGVVITRDENVRGRPSTWALPRLVPGGFMPPPDSLSWPEIKSLPHNGSTGTARVSGHESGSGDQNVGAKFSDRFDATLEDGGEGERPPDRAAVRSRAADEFD